MWPNPVSGRLEAKLKPVTGVSFFKRIVGEDGRSFLSRLDRIDVDFAEVDVVEAAITEFERKHDVDDWRELADRYRVVDAP